jgi:hypothetical protein
VSRHLLGWRGSPGRATFSDVKLMRFILLALLLILTGCQTDREAIQPASVLDQVPAELVTVKGRYDAVALCSYRRLDQTGLRKTEMQGEARVVLEGSAGRYWELRFRPTAKGTEVAFSRMQSLNGPMGGEGALDAVRACGAA